MWRRVNGEGVEADGGVRMKLTGEEARRSVNWRW